MHLLLVGCGYIGSALAHQARALWGGGIEISALCRRPGSLPAGVRPICLDLQHPEPWPNLRLPQVDGVIFCAAPATPGPEAYEAVYVRGTERVLASLASEGHRPKQVIFVSSTGVYGQDDGATVNETSATSPERYQGRLMLNAEAAARAGADAACILRFGGIYGPGRDSLVQRVLRGEAKCPAGIHYTNRIHRNDGVGAILHLLQHDSRPAVCNVVDDFPAPQAEVVRFLSNRLNVPMPQTQPEPGGITGKRVSNALLKSHGYVCQFATFKEGFESILA